MEPCPPNSPKQSAGANDSARHVPLKRRLVYLLLVYVLIVLVLIGIEVVTRLTMAPVSSLELFVNTSQQVAQVANQQQSVIFEGDPLLLWRLRPNLDHAVWDFTVVSTNAQHLREARPIGNKTAGTLRIVCLGDSVTFGYRVPLVWPDRPREFDATALPFSVLLENELRQANPGRAIEVINMAVPGYSSHQGLAWLRHDIERLEPDLLVVSFGWNDASMSDGPDRELVRTDRRVVALRWLIDHSQAFAHATRWLRQKQKPEQPPKVRPVPRVSREEYVNNMLAIAQLARDRHAGVVVLAAPYRDRTTNPPEARLMDEYRGALAAAMQQNQVPYLQILELTDEAATENEGWFGELIHPNLMGHRLIAAELLKLFAAKGMLKDLKVPTMQLL